MAKVKVDFSGLKQFQKDIANFNRTTRDAMFREATEQLAAVYVGSAIRNTPVGGTQTREVKEGEYNASKATEMGNNKQFNRAKKTAKTSLKVAYKSKGKMKYKIFQSSEHMRRSWDASDARKRGRKYRVMITNSASYASYVNDGHRQRPGRYVPILGKRLVKSWVEGLHITDKAEMATKKAQGRVLNAVVTKYLKELEK